MLSLTAPGPQAYEREAAIAIARDANDAMLGAVEAHPARAGLKLGGAHDRDGREHERDEDGGQDPLGRH